MGARMAIDGIEAGRCGVGGWRAMVGIERGGALERGWGVDGW